MVLLMKNQELLNPKSLTSSYRKNCQDLINIARCKQRNGCFFTPTQSNPNPVHCKTMYHTMTMINASFTLRQTIQLGLLSTFTYLF